jgi:two-component system NtrC family sensor kinase
MAGVNDSVRTMAPDSAAGGRLGRFSLRTRVLLGYLVLLVLFGAVLTGVFLEMRRTQASLTSLAAGYLPLSTDLSRAESSALGLELEPGQTPERIYRMRAIETKIIERLRTQLVHARDVSGAIAGADLMRGDREVMGGIAASLNEVVGKLEQYDDAHDAFVEAFEAGEGSEVWIIELIDLRAQIEVSLRGLSRRVNRRMSAVLAATEKSQRDARIAVSGVSGVAFALGLILVLTTGLMLRPVRKLIASAERLRQGNFDEPLPVTSADEVGRLARSFNAMAAAIQERERKLEERSEQLEETLAELRSSQAALIRSERLATIGQMAAQIAHEVRNPLNALGLNAELLGDEIDEGNADEAKEILGALRNEVNRLVGITEAYLAIGRAPPLRLEPFPLGQLVRDLVSFQREETERAGVDVTVELPELPEIQADVNQLRQALLNIVRNAVEALGKDGGKLAITATVEGRFVRLDLADDGPGMDAEHVARIFDPFFSTKEAGSGLGLPLTHQVIAEHGGRITCTSTPGEGTTFSIWLPTARDA